MPTIALTKENFEETIVAKDGEDKIVFIDFWASWCGPCKMFGPIFEAAAEKYPEILFAKCNTEEQQELAGMFQIRSIPTLMVFREGLAIFQQAGALPAEVLDDLVTQVKALDMDEVRAKIKAHLEQAQAEAEAQGEGEQG
jgi:thioredoxin 1